MATSMNIETNKYRQLIEFLKYDFFRELSYPRIDSSKYDDLKSQVEKHFTVSFSQIQALRTSWIKRYSVKSKSEEWDFIIGTVAFLFAYSMQKYRKKLIAENNIQGIFTLKNGFFEISNVPVGVIVLGESSADGIWLTSATSTDDVISLFSDIHSYQRNVYFTKDLNAESFMPEFYNGDREDIKIALDKYETKPLKDIADIILGKSVSRWELGEAGIPYLRQRDIQQGNIVNPDTYVIESVVDKYAKQLLQQGDLLLSKNFGQHKVAKVTSDNLPAIASNSLFIIRAYGVPEDYLYQYFTSNTGKAILEKQLSSIERGATVASINLRDLRELRVPIFDEETMIELSKVDELSTVEILPVMKQLSDWQSVKDVEAKVYNDFLQAGWSESEIQRDEKAFTFELETGNWMPDLVLLNGAEWLGAVEIKSDFEHLPPNWFLKMTEVMNEAKIPVLILSTGYYYEVHFTHSRTVKKLKNAPSKELLLSVMNWKDGD